LAQYRAATAGWLLLLLQLLGVDFACTNKLKSTMLGCGHGRRGNGPEGAACGGQMFQLSGFVARSQATQRLRLKTVAKSTNITPRANGMLVAATGFCFLSITFSYVLLPKTPKPHK